MVFDVMVCNVFPCVLSDAMVLFRVGNTFMISACVVALVPKLPVDDMHYDQLSSLRKPSCKLIVIHQSGNHRVVVG